MAEEKAAVAATDSGFNLMRFLGEVKAEMQKVQWTTRRELIVDTGVVFIAVVIVCVLVWACDTFFARLFSLILR